MLQRRHIAVAVQLAFSVGAGAALSVPAHAQQITCPAVAVSVTTATEFNAVASCPVNGTLNISNTGVLSNNTGAGLFNSNTGTLNNYGTLTNTTGAFLTNNGTLINYGTLNNAGSTGNYALFSNSGTLNNSGVLFNDGAGFLPNRGTINNLSGAIFYNNSGTLVNYAGGTLSNAGTVFNSATLRNYGTLSNNVGSTVMNTSALRNMSGAGLTNAGVFNNTGSLRNYAGAALTNSGTLNNNTGGSLRNYSTTFTNSGTFNNNYELRNFAGAVITNSGTLNHNAGFSLRNDGTLNNTVSGTLNSNTVLFNMAGAVLNNSGTLNNNGASPLLRNYGTLNNNAGATLSNSTLLVNQNGATLTNGGTLNNNSGGNLRNYANATLANTGTLNNNSGASLRTYATSTFTNSGTLVNSGSLFNPAGATFSNAGTLTVNAGGNLYGSGTLTQSAGTLRANGTLTQANIAINGGTLTGTGTVTGAVVNSGSLLPGAVGTPGTLTVVGSLTQNPAATLVVNVTPAQASRVTITGTASVAGAVQVVAGAGTYPTTTYTILSATGGVTGTFSGVTSDSAFFVPTLSYDPNTVFLTHTQVATFNSVALTPNQLGISTVLGTLQTSGGGGADLQAIITTLNGLPAGAARAGFDSLAGAGHASAGFGAQFGVARGFIRSILNRFNGAAGGSGAIGFAPGRVQLVAGNPVLSDAAPVYAQAGGQSASGSSLPAAARDGAWALVYGSDGKTTGDSNANGYRQDGIGFAVGADREINARWRAGAAVNVGSQRVRDDGGAGRSDTDGVSVAGYARYADGPLAVSAVAGAGRNSNEGARNVTISGTTRVASADFNSDQQFAHAEAAYTIQMKGYTLAPVAALGYTRVANPGYTETGGGGANLSVSSQSRESIKSYLGVRTVYSLDGGGRGLQLTAHTLWSHEFGNADNALATAQFAGAPGVFRTGGVNLKRDGAVLGLGLSGELRRNLALSSDITVETRSKQTNATLQFGARYTW